MGEEERPPNALAACRRLGGNVVGGIALVPIGEAPTAVTTTQPAGPRGEPPPSPPALNRKQRRAARRAGKRR